MALGRAATASSAVGGPFGDRQAAAAVDGIFATRWVAATSEPGQWWQLELGQICDIGRCQLFIQFPTRAYRYRLEHSADGQTWSPYADHTADEVFQSPQFDCQTVRARYLHVVFTATEPSATLPAICWFRVY